MTYSQAPLLKLLSVGKIPGESGIPQHIETVLSNVFLFNERGYKVYKNDNEFINKNFGDISIKKRRFKFSSIDFEWNHQLAGEIYLRLQGVKVDADGIHFVDNYRDAEELLIVTKRLSLNTSLFAHLRNNDLVEDDYYEIGRQFAKCEENFIWHGDLPKESSLENMLWRHHDVIEWTKDVEMCVPREERETYARQLMNLIKQVYADGQTHISVMFDVHCLNAFYINRMFYPFDVVSSKDAWRFGPFLINIYRLATDVFALVGEQEFRAVLRGYYDCLNRNFPSKETERLLVIYASLIMMPYLYMLGKTDADKHKAAIKYHDFLKRYATI
ncbi:MAG: hypothetical protein AAB850_00955 [Patescibacteria group bacterium]